MLSKDVVDPTALSDLVRLANQAGGSHETSMSAVSTGTGAVLRSRSTQSQLRRAIALHKHGNMSVTWRDPRWDAPEKLESFHNNQHQRLGRSRHWHRIHLLATGTVVRLEGRKCLARCLTSSDNPSYKRNGNAGVPRWHSVKTYVAPLARGQFPLQAYCPRLSSKPCRFSACRCSLNQYGAVVT